jgi:hypothetical protein
MANQESTEATLRLFAARGAASHWKTAINGGNQGLPSSGRRRVAVMKDANLGDGDDPSPFGRLDLA